MPSVQGSVQCNAVSGGGAVVKLLGDWESHSSCDEDGSHLYCEWFPQAIWKSRIRADGQASKREGCCPVGLQNSETPPPGGLARFIMTALLLRCMCQQFEMALVLRALL